jgi:NRPS condensation-like uncharacterized protein
MSLKKKDSKLQPIDLFTVSLPTDYAKLIVGFNIQTTKKLDIQKLKKAIDRTNMSIPQFSCRFDLEKLRFVEAGYGADDFVVLHKEQASYEQEPTIEEGGPMMAVHIYDHGDGHIVKFRVDHVIGDARGMLEYFYLLCKHYNDPSTPVAVNHRNIYRMTRRFAALRRTKGVRGVLRTFKDLKTIPRPSGFLPYAEGGVPEPNICVTELSAAQVKKIKEKGKTLDATLNDVFLAALFAAVFTMTDKNKSRIDIPVDMRPSFSASIEGKMTVTNFSSVYVVYANRADYTSLDSLIRVVSQTMNERKSTKAFFGVVNMLYSFARFLSLERMKKFIAASAIPLPESYCNLNIIDDRKLVFDGNEVTAATFSNSYLPAPYFLLTISTFKGTTTFNAARNCSPENRQIGDRILQTVKQILLDWSEK